MCSQANSRCLSRSSHDSLAGSKGSRHSDERRARDERHARVSGGASVTHRRSIAKSRGSEEVPTPGIGVMGPAQAGACLTSSSKTTKAEVETLRSLSGPKQARMGSVLDPSVNVRGFTF